MKRIYTFLIVIMFNIAFLMSACTAGNADSAMSAVSETSATGTVMDRIDEPKAETTTAQTTQSHRKQRKLKLPPLRQLQRLQRQSPSRQRQQPPLLQSLHPNGRKQRQAVLSTSTPTATAVKKLYSAQKPSSCTA